MSRPMLNRPAPIPDDYRDPLGEIAFELEEHLPRVADALERIAVALEALAERNEKDR